MRLLVLTSALCAVSLSAQRPAPDHHLVEVAIRDARYLARLLRLDLDLASCHAPEAGTKQVEVVATDGDIDRLRRAGFKFRVVTRNLEDHYEREMKRLSLGQPDTLTPPLGQGAMGGHYTLAQMVAILDSFALKHPKICAKKVSLGKSIEGRDIWMVKISDNVGVNENEPEVFYDALHHAREPLSMEATLLFMDELLDGYGKDPEATFIVDERELYFVPCVNPDGYEYNRSIRPNGGGMWRKNRRNNGNSTFGVDLNRNYATGWTAPNGGNSTNSGSNVYRGTKAFSEPETLAIDNFARLHKFVQVNSCHTYTEVLLQPWGYKSGLTANSADYARLGRQLLAKNNMRQGAASTILYIAAGTALDHHHAAHGSYSWTPELGKSSEGGFWPAGTNIITIARRHQPMFRAMALTSGASLGVASVKVHELSGNNNGTVEPGETGALVVTVQNDGAASTTSAATLKLTSLTAGISILSGNASLGIISRFGSAANTTTSLTFQVPSNFPGPIARLEVAVAGDGRGTKVEVSVVLAAVRVAVSDDMEVDRGFSRASVGTATTGLWGRGLPQQTVSGGLIIQPGSQHTPGGKSCWVTDARAGSRAGQYDVDNGYTDLLSPVFDLTHLGLAWVEFYRWYADSTSDDPFEVFVSRNGGSTYTLVFSSSTRTGSWVKYSYEIPGTLTAQMRFKMRAQDLSPSLVEAAVDDFTIRGVTDDGNLTVMTSGVIGSTLQLGLNGSTGGMATVLLGAKKTAGISLPGIAGKLMLDPATTVILTGHGFGASGFTPVDMVIPNVPGLSGKTFYWQLLYAKGGTVQFGNVQATNVK